MNYKNGRDMLPPSLLKELQKYVDGEFIYIPKRSEQRARWGELSGARKLLAERNKEICGLYSDGWTVADLEGKYHLTSESIRKIIVGTNRRSSGNEITNADSAYVSQRYRK